jgi:hypothetical protein
MNTDEQPTLPPVEPAAPPEDEQSAAVEIGGVKFTPESVLGMAKRSCNRCHGTGIMRRNRRRMLCLCVQRKLERIAHPKPDVPVATVKSDGQWAMRKGERIQGEIDKLQGEIDAVNADLAAQTQDARGTLNKRIAALADIQEQIRVASDECDQLQSTIAGLADILEQRRAQLADGAARVDQMRTEARAAVASVEDANRALQAIGEPTRALLAAREKRLEKMRRRMESHAARHPEKH